MSTISLRLSDSLHEQVKLMAARGNRAAYDEVLGRVAEAPPSPDDTWPPDPTGKG